MAITAINRKLCTMLMVMVYFVFSTNYVILCPNVFRDIRVASFTAKHAHSGDLTGKHFINAEKHSDRTSKFLTRPRLVKNPQSIVVAIGVVLLLLLGHLFITRSSRVDAQYLDFKLFIFLNTTSILQIWRI